MVAGVLTGGIGLGAGLALSGGRYEYVDAFEFAPKTLKYKGGQLRSLQQEGVHIVVVNKKASADEIKDARQECRDDARPRSSMDSSLVTLTARSTGSTPANAVTEANAKNDSSDLHSSAFGKGPTNTALAPDGILTSLGIAATTADTGGAQIMEIAQGSIAEKAGFRVSDVINFVNGKPVGTTSALAAELSNGAPGTKIRLGYVFHTSALGYVPKEVNILLPQR